MFCLLSHAEQLKSKEKISILLYSQVQKKKKQQEDFKFCSVLDYRLVKALKVFFFLLENLYKENVFVSSTKRIKYEINSLKTKHTSKVKWREKELKPVDIDTEWIIKWILLGICFAYFSFFCWFKAVSNRRYEKKVRNFELYLLL